MSTAPSTRIVRCCHCKGMMRVAARALSVFCPHCQKRASLEDLVIVGSHPGKALMTCGDVRVEAPARLHLEVYGRRIVVLGRVTGPVQATESVEVGATGRVIGDIRAPRIVIAEGAVIQGRCEMTRPPAPPPESPPAVEQPADGAAEIVDAPLEPLAKQRPPPPPRPRPLALPKSPWT